MRWERRLANDAAAAFGAWTGGVLLLGAAASALWLRLGLPLPSCGFRAWTGVPCATCGATRMVRALLSGDLAQAVAWNPLAFAALMAIGAWSAWSTVRLVLGLPQRRLVLDRRERRLAWTLAVLGVLAGWIYVISSGRI